MMCIMNVTLQTPPLILRPPQVGDAEPIARYLKDFEVAGNLAQETTFSIKMPDHGFAGHIGFISDLKAPFSAISWVDHSGIAAS
ncbi:MAG: hypothetical protein MO846_06590 [Candidatus Devosia symbiotica]|nr:hypothetical protein [Candidatus Devosia symbiotica]